MTPVDSTLALLDVADSQCANAAVTLLDNWHTLLDEAVSMCAVVASMLTLR